LRISASQIVPELDTSTTVLIRGMRHSSPSTPGGNQLSAEVFSRAKPLKNARKMTLSEHRKMMKPVRV
jgi:hypothetical protein